MTKVEKLKKIDDKNHSIKYWTYQTQDKLIEILTYIESGKKGIKHIQDLVEKALDETRVIEANQKIVEDEIYSLMYEGEE